MVLSHQPIEVHRIKSICRANPAKGAVKKGVRCRRQNVADSVLATENKILVVVAAMRSAI